MSQKLPADKRLVSGPTAALAGFLAILGFVLGLLFLRCFDPAYVLFSNDGPLGQLMAEHSRLPGTLVGSWSDLNSYGSRDTGAMPNITFALLWLLGPLAFAKFYAALTLLFVGACAWVFGRQLGLGSLAAMLVGLAAPLGSDFFGTSCWGVGSQTVCFGLNYLALAVVISPHPMRPWLRYPLAGFAVGLGVMEAFDIGALFSLFTAAFVVFQALTDNGSWIKRSVQGGLRVATVAVFAGFIATVALAILIGTQVKGVVGMGQDAESKAARWSQATLASLPKKEVLGMFVPGLFGFRADTPEGGAYWGTAGSDPAWDSFLKSDRKGPPPSGSLNGGMGSNYAGVLVVLVAAFGIAQSFRKRGGPFTDAQRKAVWFWCAVVGVGMLLMFGRFAPFYQFFYALPYASTIRNPAKFLHVVEWALLILFAYGAGALGRVGFSGPVSAAGGLSSHWKAWWAKAVGFDRRWVVGSGLALVAFGIAWMIYAASRGQLEQHLVEMMRLQYMAQGQSPDPGVFADSARATASFSVGQAGRTLLFLLASVALVAITVSGYFRGARAKVGGFLLVAVLIADLAPVSRVWIVMVNWKEKYETNPVVEFLRERAHERRVTKFPLERFVDMSRLPREMAPVVQQYQLLNQLYVFEWMQHLFPYYNVQSLDVVQEPRVAEEKAAFEAVMTFTPLRRWELSNTRYLLGPTAFLDFLNQQVDAGKSRFRVATRFDPAAKPGTTGRRLEQITTTMNTNGQLAVFEFTGALPRAKLYSNWKVSTNDPAVLKEWVKSFETRGLPPEMSSPLAAQSPTDLATLHELADKAFDPAQAVLLAEALPVAPGTNQNPGAVDFVSYAPKHIVLKARTEAPSVLLLNDKFDPNWSVKVDGQPARLLRCNFLMRGVFLEKAGEHQIEFYFAPSITALGVSLAALLLGAALLGYLTVSTWRGNRATALPVTGSESRTGARK